MKKFASKLMIWAVPVLSLTFIAGFTYATSRPKTEDPKKGTSEKVLKKVKFAHEDEIDTYLTSIRSYMLVPPRDGRFGAGRIPTLHGENQSKIPGFEALKTLTAGDYNLISAVAGNFPSQWKKSYEDAIAKGKMKPEEMPTSRVTWVHTALNLRNQSRQDGEIEYNEIAKTFQDTNRLTREKGYDVYSNSITIGGHEAWIMSKSVRASEKSCYKCHTDIKEGEPIGYVMAILIKKGA